MFENEVLHALYLQNCQNAPKMGFCPTPYLPYQCGAKPQQNNRRQGFYPNQCTYSNMKIISAYLWSVECTQESVLKTDILPHFCPIFAHNCPTGGAKCPKNNRRWDLTPNQCPYRIWKQSSAYLWSVECTQESVCGRGGGGGGGGGADA